MSNKKLFLLVIVLIFTISNIACKNHNIQEQDKKEEMQEDKLSEEKDKEDNKDISPEEKDGEDNQNMPEGYSQEESSDEVAEYIDVSYSRVGVHDPSVIKVDDMYYIFGSHMAYAKSKDLMNWRTFRMNINTEYNDLMGDIWEEYMKTPTNPNLSGNLWAPDIMYNEALDKYCMYLSINGNQFNSAIVLLTADDIEGPYEYIGPVVFSGFGSNHPPEKTDVYQVLGEDADLTRYKSTKNTKLNAIDPGVEYDEEGNLWMSFGSWFGGIYMLKLDENTGLRDYSYTYVTERNVSDQYYGYKLAGGNEVSGEGPYIQKFGDYYYMFLSYGGLTQEGGYQMRVFRSKDIRGPYVDELGQSAVYEKHQNNLFTNIGVRIVGSYKFSGSAYTLAAQGHNSVFLDDDGKMINVYHTRFADGLNGNAEAHQVRVQQLFINENDWLVMAPYEYSGETISETGYTKNEMVGNYEFVVHTPSTYYQTSFGKQLGIAKTLNINLKSDGSVVGDVSGKWNYNEGTPYMSITIDDVKYDGVFLRQANETEHKLVMTFTALGDNVAVMGSKQ